MSGIKLTMYRNLSLLSVVLLIFALKCEANDVIAKLDVKIYYEALCSDSISFFKNQLQHSMTTKGRLAYARLRFVPYGHVIINTDRTTGEKTLQCQHGKKECELNADHACIIENNNQREVYDMITCLMRGFNTDFDKCARNFGISLEAATRCRSSRSIADILKKHGDDTYSQNLSFVPTIAFDGVNDWYEQREILYNFDKVFCRKYKSKFNITLAGC